MSSTITVSSGVTSSALTISSGVQLDVLSGGTVVSTTVSSGGYETVYAGGQSIDDTVSTPSSYINVLNGATVENVTLNDSNLFLGGVAQGSGGSPAITLASGNNTVVLHDGTVIDGTISAGLATSNTLVLENTTTYVLSNWDTQYEAFQTLEINAIAPVEIVGSQTVQMLDDTPAGATIVVNSGDNLTIGSLPANPTAVDFIVSSGGVVNLQGFGAAAEQVTFAGIGGTLKTTTADGFQNLYVSGLAAGDLVDLTNVSVADETASISGGEVILTDTATSAKTTLHTPFSGGVALSADGSGGTLVTFVSPFGVSLTSDTGSSSTDGITSDPALTGTGTSGSTVVLSDGNTPLGSATVTAEGTWSFTPSGLTSGAHVISAVESIPASGTQQAETLSSTVSLTLETQAPTPSLAMTSGSDTGIVGDDITYSATPSFTGLVTGGDGDQVVLYDGGIAIASATVANGSWTATPTSPMSNGAQVVSAVLTDAAGNVASPVTLGVDIESVAPAAGSFSPPLVAAISDTGFSSSDGITNVTMPELVGSGGIAGSTITVYDGATVLGSSAVSTSGTWAIQVTSPLSAGLHVLSATDTSVAGLTTLGAYTNSITIDETIPTPTIALAQASHTGVASLNITDETLPVISGTGTVGDRVVVYDYGQAIASSTVGGNGVWSLQPGAPLVDGTHQLKAVETEIAGNVGSSTMSLVVDTTTPAPPPAPLLAAVSDSGVVGDDITNVTMPVLSGSNATPGVTMTLFDGGSVIGSATVNEVGGWSIHPTTPLSAGVHQLTLTDTSLSGEVSPQSTPLALTIDTAVPTPTIVLDPSSDTGVVGDDITDQTQPTVSGVGAAGDHVSLAIDGTVVARTLVTSNGTWSVTAPSALSNALHGMTVYEYNVAGTVGSATVGITVDNTVPAAPAAPVLASAYDSGVVGDGITNVTVPVFSGSGAAVGDTISLLDGGTIIGTGIVAGNGDWSVTPTSALAVGSHTLTLTDTSVAGELSAPSAPTMLSVVPMTIGLTSASDSNIAGDDITNVNTPVVSGLGVAGDTITLTQGDQTLGSALVGNDGTWTVSSTALVDGQYTLVASEADGGNHLLATSPGLAVTIDTMPPVAPSGLMVASGSDSGISNTDGITNVTMPVISGMGEAGDTVVLSDTSGVIGSGLVGDGGTWSVTPTSALADGSYQISATETDLAGNVSQVSSALAVTIDTMPPVAPSGLMVASGSDSGVSNTDGITNVTMPVISGMGEAGDTVVLSDTSGVIGSGLVGVGGTWSVTPTSALADGSYQISATETDLAGNVSQVSSALAVTIDTMPPLPPMSLALAPQSDSGIPGDDITNVTTPTITGTGTAGDTVTLYAGATAVGSALVGDGGSWSVTASTLTGGAYLMTASESDVAGNVSAASAPLFVDIDTFTPATPSLTDTSTTSAPSSPVVGGNAPLAVSVTLTDGATNLGSVYTQASGAWTMSLPALSVGTHVLTAVATDAAGNNSLASGSLTVVVAQDGSYNVTNSSGTDVRFYDASGSLTAIATRDGSGRLIETVGTTQAVREIYDSAGNLIGSVSEPSSGPTSTPLFNVTAGTLSATIVTSDAGSLVSLSSETNTVTTHGADTVSAGAGTTVVHGDGPSLSVIGGAGLLTVDAATGPLTVTGGSGSASVQGGSGMASITGGSAGHNLLQAGSGNTTLTGGGSGDTLIGGSGSDVMIMQANSTAFAGSGSTSIFGADGGNVIGGSGSDVLVSGGGNEMFSAGTGSTTIFGGSGSDSMAGGASGQTLMVGGSGSEQFVGGAGITTVFGGNGTDAFFSGQGTMTVIEGNGADTARIGSGTTMVYGGLGTDVYDIVNGDAGGAAVIAGFKVGTDQIGLYGYGPSAPQTSVIGGNTVLSLSDGTNITLLGVTDLPKSAIG